MIGSTASAPTAGYADIRARLAEQLAALPEGARVRLRKPTSNLFRGRSEAPQGQLDVAGLDHVFSVDPVTRTADVGGMTTYEDLVRATLPHGLIPKCVPQLRTITLGGAVTGLGIESASFRNGCPHESVAELDLLVGTGEVLTVTPAADDPNRRLFFGFPNSYGSLGYALRLRIELEPVEPYVELLHVPFASAREATAAIAEITESREWQGRRVDFLDGTRFSAAETYLTLGTFTSHPAGRTPSDYTGQRIYYRSIQQRGEDLLTTHDYLWRWDTDWFWCSRAFGAQNPVIRRFWPASRRRSDVYWKLVAADRRHGFSARLDAALGRPEREYVIQDVEVPVDTLPEFLDFFDRHVGISPVWLCPLRQRDPDVSWPLYELDPATTYVNVGFWSSVPIPGDAAPDEGRVNRLIEAKVTELGGRKSLYSTAYYARDEFDRLYGGDTYANLKSEYDPAGRFPGLYEKTVGGR